MTSTSSLRNEAINAKTSSFLDCHGGSSAPAALFGIRRGPRAQCTCAEADPSRGFDESATILGGHVGGATPVPIPNTAVKPTGADGTAVEALWESRTPPGLNPRPQPKGWGLVFCADSGLHSSASILAQDHANFRGAGRLSEI